MKRLCSLFISLAIVLLAIIPALAADYGCSLTLDSKVQTGKGFTVQLNVFGGGDVAAALFTVCYDPNVMELKSASLADGIDGKLEYSISEGTASLVFLNAKGETLAQDERAIITLKFNALSTPCNAYITLYGEQAVSSDESYLPCGYGIEYPIELAEKVSGSVSRSGGTRVNTSPSSGSSKNSSSKSSKASNISGQEHPNASTSYSNGTVTSLGSGENPQSPFIYIVFGVIIALCVVCAVTVIYRAGKRRGEIHQSQKSDRENSNGSADNDVKITDDAACLDDIFNEDNADFFDSDEE